MKTITVCVGSSCYIKGAHAVAKALEELIAKNDLGATVELKGSFCLGRCREGVAVTVDGENLPRVTADNVSQIFSQWILLEVQPNATH